MQVRARIETEHLEVLLDFGPNVARLRLRRPPLDVSVDLHELSAWGEALEVLRAASESTGEEVDLSFDKYSLGHLTIAPGTVDPDRIKLGVAARRAWRVAAVAHLEKPHSTPQLLFEQAQELEMLDELMRGGIPDAAVLVRDSGQFDFGRPFCVPALVTIHFNSDVAVIVPCVHLGPGSADTEDNEPIVRVAVARSVVLDSIVWTSKESPTYLQSARWFEAASEQYILSHQVVRWWESFADGNTAPLQD